jgi:hypothetical protein
MLKNLLFLATFFIGQTLAAQVSKTIVVEHFTNTRCGICGFKNPQLFANLDNHPEILHLATHPSAPYANCVLYQHNPAENDARTNFYGVYGSTPRIVIQGDVIGGSPFDNEELFTPYEGQTSPASINIQQSKTAESIEAFITVQTEEVHDLGNLNLYVVLAEDTLFYEAPNGEDLHFNVFRKNVSDANGFPLTLPAELTGEVTFSITADIHEDWVAERIFVMAILQDADTKEVIQAAAVPASMNETISSTSTLPLLENVVVFPNPTNDILVVKMEDSTVSTGQLFDLSGKLIVEKTFQQEGVFKVENLSPGAYLLEIKNENGRVVEKVIVD